MMTLLPFDTFDKIDIYNLANEAEVKWNDSSIQKNSDGYIFVLKIVDGSNKIRLPFSICDYFGVAYDIKKDGEFIWEKVEDIKYQIDYELGNLMTNGHYKAAINPTDNSFGIAFKKEVSK